MAEIYTPDNLFAGNVAPVVADIATIVSGAGILTRGTVLGLVTLSGKLTIVDSSKSDGTQLPYAVLAENVDATSADKDCGVYLTGEFNNDKLVFGGTDTAATHKVNARKIGIFFKNTL